MALPYVCKSAIEKKENTRPSNGVFSPPFVYCDKILCKSTCIALAWCVMVTMLMMLMMMMMMMMMDDDG